MLPRRTLLKSISLLVVTPFLTPLAGCVSSNSGWFNPASSIDSVNLSPSAAQAIAGDLVPKLAEHVGPGTGTIALRADNSPFAHALIDAMRGWGYAVATPDQQAKDDKIIPVSFTISQADTMIFVRITTPKVELSKAYAASANGANPASPLSVLSRTS
ncbi:conjugal transfer protein TrbH [Rhizobium sp.]|jgi:type IV secretion system protein TrbH|uniref:conjugal transfer protein TrbH n=1 Tax=Rhizobium sp. TaxID=391 RepID=UPI000E915A53|nr:conjugal transfer protein TrbH [Rhizobium sp.]